MSCLQVIFVLIWMKQTLIWFNLQRDGNGNGLSNIKDTFAESLELQMSVLLQSMCIFKAGPSSLYNCCAKYKEKVYMCQILTLLSIESPDIFSSRPNLKGKKCLFWTVQEGRPIVRLSPRVFGCHKRWKNLFFCEIWNNPAPPLFFIKPPYK